MVKNIGNSKKVAQKGLNTANKPSGGKGSTSPAPRPTNGPSTTGNVSGGGRGNNPPKK